MTGGRLFLAMLVAALALSACGKSAPVRPPDDAATAYTFPKVYPNPATVLPAGSTDTTLRSREIPVGAGNLSPLPNARKRTIYGDPDAQ
jgi:predicted small lipoprotein YifL